MSSTPPPYAVTPILKYLKPQSKIWCPFDTADSLFPKILEKQGHEVVYTHIQNGEDFFEISPPEGTDYIVSNPPYSLKTEVLERLFELKIPFAMLIGVVGIFESQKRFDLFRNNPFEVLYLNRRVSYFKDYEEQKPSKNPPFSSAYFCSGILPQQVCFAEIDKNYLTIE